MSYETRAYQKVNSDGFPPDPVVVLVVEGTHDVSRLVNLLNGGSVLIEQLEVGKRIRRQLNRKSAGRDALALLAKHGGPDFREDAEPGSRPSAAPGRCRGRCGGQHPVADPDPNSGIYSRFCVACIEQCHDYTDENADHRCPVCRSYLDVEPAGGDAS